MTPTPADPGAIDLESYKEFTTQTTSKLIAAVEALRERVAAQENGMDSLLECWAHIHVQLEKFTGRKFDETELPRTVGGVLEAFEKMEARAETAEARAVALAGALKPFCGPGGGGNMPAFHDILDDHVVWSNSGEGVTAADCRWARAVLVATPTKALERARAVEAVLSTAKKVCNVPTDAWSSQGPLTKELANALAKLDALGKEGP